MPSKNTLYQVPPTGIAREYVVYHRQDGRGLDATWRWGPPIESWNTIDGDVLHVVTVPSLPQTSATCKFCKKPLAPSQWVMYSRNMNPWQIFNIESAKRIHVQQLWEDPKYTDKPHLLDIEPAACVHWDCVQSRKEFRELMDLTKKAKALNTETSRAFDRLNKILPTG